MLGAPFVFDLNVAGNLMVPLTKSKFFDMLALENVADAC
jgi:hypothetical protein